MTDINGTFGSDTLNGTEGDDTINGFGGNDVLNGLGGADTLIGGSGNDTLNGDAGNDVLNGDFDDDTLNGGAGRDTLLGGSGDDTLNGEAGLDILDGGSGVNILTGGTGGDVFTVSIRAEQDNTITDFGNGNDQIDLSAFNIGTISQLTPYLRQVGNDVIFQTFFRGADEILRIENTSLSQLTSADFLFNTDTLGLDVMGSPGSSSFNDDVIFGGNGDDTLDGGSGEDELNGGNGDDALFGGTGTNLLRGGNGEDAFSISARGTQDTTVVDFVDGEDLIDVSGFFIGSFDQLESYIRQVGDDVVFQTFAFRSTFNPGDEIFTIENISLSDLTEDDFIFSEDTAGITQSVPFSSQSSVLFGGNGSDTLIGLGGNDELNGGFARDTLDGGLGVNELTGGFGRDFFTLGSRGQQTTTILDFSDGNDVIDLSAFNIGSFDQIVPFLTQVGDNVVFQTFFNRGTFTTNTETLIIEDVSLSQITAADFIFNLDPQELNIQLGTTGRQDVLFGGIGDDFLIGANGNTQVSGGDGDDVVGGGGGLDNELTGGEGNDLFAITGRGAQGVTILDFTDGEDRIDVSRIDVGSFDQLLPFLTQVGDDVVLETFYNVGSFSFNAGVEMLIIRDVDLDDLSGADFLFNQDSADITINVPNDGDDFVRFTSIGDDVINAGAGDDILSSGNGQDVLNGNSGNDTLYAGNAADVLNGGAGDDELFGDGGEDELNGGEGDDTLDGGFGDDDINGDAGNDLLFGGLGNGVDVLSGGAGDDTLNGQNGTDQLFGGEGNDTLSGQNRNDVLQGEDGQDILNGNRGQDTLLGGDDNDTLLGGQGDDQVSGQNGDDELFGGGNNDTLNGGSGDDTLDGGSGIDTLNGGSGEDTLLGGNSNDVLNGGGGVDVLQGGQGNDILTGGSSSTDTFFFDTATDGGVDTITDYQDGLDIIEFAGGVSFSDLTIRQASNGDDTIVEVAGSDVTIRLDDTDASDITIDDFVFDGSVMG